MLSKATAISTALLFVALPSSAIDFQSSGFLTLAAGKTLSGSVKGVNEAGYECPCLISDYSQAGVYSDSWTLKPDSKLGLQGSLVFSPDFQLTGQIVSRGSRDGKVNLEWVYGSYQVNDTNTLQVGRKRLPLFYYSEQQDISFTYPWVHLPPQTYGWEAVNYNGANWNHQWNWGSWSGQLNMFAGSETRKDSDYLKLYNGKDSVSDTRWSNIVGAELIGSYNWFEGRLAIIQSDTEGRIRSEGENWSTPAKQQIFGASGLVDYNDWLGTVELFFSDRTESYGRDLAYTFTLGRRLGDYTALVTHGLYQQKIYADNPAEYDASISQEKHRMNSLVVRYDLNSSMAVKMQLDRWRDFSGEWFKQNYGNSTALSIGFDMVF